MYLQMWNKWVKEDNLSRLAICAFLYCEKLYYLANCCVSFTKLKQWRIFFAFWNFSAWKLISDSTGIYFYTSKGAILQWWFTFYQKPFTNNTNLAFLSSKNKFTSIGNGTHSHLFRKSDTLFTCTNLSLTCKTRAFRHSKSHALLILEIPKSKVPHETEFSKNQLYFLLKLFEIPCCKYFIKYQKRQICVICKNLEWWVEGA